MEASEIVVLFVAGAVIGAAYWATLWLVVRRLPAARQPGFWLLSTTGVRIALLLAAFFVLMDGQWQRLAFCVLGFLAARIAITTWVKTGLSRPSPQR